MSRDWTVQAEAAARAHERAAEWLALLPYACAVMFFVLTLIALLALRRH